MLVRSRKIHRRRRVYMPFNTALLAIAILLLLIVLFWGEGLLR